jgi:ketosteroid isomerase-like protein
MKLLFFAITFTLFQWNSCSDKNKGETPQSVMKRYERLVLEMNADSISQLFTNDAEVGHANQKPVKGRDSIYAFLSSFKNVRVITNVDSISNISIKNDSAIVDGKYKQSVVLQNKDTVHVAGKFTANMVRDKNKNWLISKMHTQSL